MDIVENLDGWEAAYKATWLAHYEATGETDWSQYPKPQNEIAPSGAGIDLSNSRLLLISSAGGYLKDSQEPFDAANLLGDYSLRGFPMATPFDALAYAQEHYDHTAIDADPQVLLPLRHLEAMVAEGIIGELVPQVISFSGYLPDVKRVVEELIPAISKIAIDEQARAALLVPA